MRNEHIMAAPIDMLCHSYKSVWIDLIEAKKKVSLVLSYLNHVLSPAIETILFLGFYFHLSAF